MATTSRRQIVKEEVRESVSGYFGGRLSDEQFDHAWSQPLVSGLWMNAARKDASYQEGTKWAIRQFIVLLLEQSSGRMTGNVRKQATRPSASDAQEGTARGVPRIDWLNESVTATDRLRAKALALYSLVEQSSHLGIWISQFRNRFLNGDTLPQTDVHRFLYDASQSIRPKKTNDSDTITLEEGYLYLMGPLTVPADSLLGRAKGITDILSERYNWDEDQAILFLFAGEVPETTPIKIDPWRHLELEDVFQFGNYAPRPWTIEVAPWLAPEKVAQALRRWQSTWTGQPKGFGERGLHLFYFVVDAMSRRNMGERLSDQEWRQVHQDWQQAHPEWMERYTVTSRFKAEYMRVKERLLDARPMRATQDSANKEKPKRGGARKGAGRPRKDTSA